MDNPQPAGQLRVALPLRGPMGATVSLGVWGRAQLALHHLHPVPHCVLEEEPPKVFARTHFNAMHKRDFNLTSTSVTSTNIPSITPDLVMSSKTF